MVKKCQNCGKEFEDSSSNKNALFCSVKCRSAYKRKQRKEKRMNDFKKIFIWIPWPTSQGWASAGGWWKKIWMPVVMAILLVAVISLTCLTAFFPRERIVTVTDVRTVIKTVTKEVPVEVTKEVVKEVEVVKEIPVEVPVNSIVVPERQDPMMYRSARETAEILRLVFPNVSKESLERTSYGICSKRDLTDFISFFEGSELLANLDADVQSPDDEIDAMRLLAGLTEIWEPEEGNGVLDPTAGSENDSFHIFMFYDEQENIKVMGYDLSGAKGSGNYWVITSYPEAKFFLGLY
jgi:hypothetical protein